MPGPVELNGGSLQMLASVQAGRRPGHQQAHGLNRTPGKNAQDVQLQKACAELESLFIYQLFQEMRKTVAKSGLIDQGQAGPMVDSMMDMEMSKELSSQKGIGLASVLYDQLKNYQKAAGP
jgi:flagellar protein FlgJ